MKTHFPRQSSAADWEDSVDFEDAGNEPLWSAVPADLVVNMTVIPQKPHSDHEPSITTNSGDGNGYVTPGEDGVVFITIPASVMTDLAPDNYGVDRRFSVFINIELTVDDTHTAGLEGVLSVYKGA